MPAKKIKNKASAKISKTLKNSQKKQSKVSIKKPVKKNLVKKIVKKPTKTPNKAVKKNIKTAVKNKKIVGKNLKTLTKKVSKEKLKPVVKISKKIKNQKILSPKRDGQKDKKTSKKIIEKKSLKLKESTTKTSAKIIAKAKNTSREIKAKILEPEVIAPDKKNDAQKNLIIVKKLLESRNKVAFKKGDFAVYPSHGVGQISDIEKTIALGQEFSCYLMYFEKERLTIKVPVNSAEKIGLRHLVSKQEMDEIFGILRSGVKKLKGMWSRRAQEYETKINSGNIVLLAEVLRDLTRDIEDGERSYSERIIYETAVNRLAAEYTIVCGVDFEEAKNKVISTAKDKLGTSGKAVQKDEFDDFDYDPEASESDDDEDGDEDEDEDEDEDDDYYGDDEDDDGEKKSKKKSAKKSRKK